MRKQTLILLLCCLVFNTWAQGYSDFMESFMDAQVTPSPGSNGTGSTVDLNGSSTISSNSSRTCTEKDQTDVPVELLLALLYEKGSTYEVKHEPKDGSLYLNIPKMRGNCNDMFRWTVDESISKSGEKEYYVRAVFKQLDRYDILDKDYKVTQKIYKGNLDGFQKCLTESFAKSEPAIYHNSKVKLSDDVDETGKVYLASNGPVGSVIGNHGDVECMKVSNFKPDEDGVVVLSREDDKKMEEHKYAQAICNKKDYREINKHIHEFTIFRDLLVKARDELLIKEYKELAEKIESTKSDELSLTDDEKKLISDFKTMIFDPLLKKIEEKYVLFEKATGDAQDTLLSQLETLQNKAKAFLKSPYVSLAQLGKLKESGLFTQTKKLEEMNIYANEFALVGKRYTSGDGKKYRTPNEARAYADIKMKELEANYPSQERDYDIANCRIFGTSTSIYAKANYRTKKIERRTKNYQDEINSLVQEMYKKCNRYYVNQQKCFYEYGETITELKKDLQKANDFDDELADKYIAEGDRIAAIEIKAKEKCGDKLIVSDDGSDDDDDDDDDPTNTSPEYTFNYTADNGQGVMLQQMGMMGNQMMNPQMMGMGQQFNQMGMYGNSGMNMGMGMGNQGFSFNSGNMYGPQYGFGNNMYGQQFGNPMMGQQFGNPMMGNQFGNPMMGQQFGNPMMGNQFGSPYGMGGNSFMFNSGGNMGFGNPMMQRNPAYFGY